MAMSAWASRVSKNTLKNNFFADATVAVDINFVPLKFMLP